MKIRRAVIASMLMVFGILGTAGPAHAGLWCENADRVDPLVGSGCRAAVSTVCKVVDKTGGACLA